jgi:hypothetical protein
MWLDLENVVKLLTREREELYEGERAVCLFQFRTWIVFPDITETNHVNWAGLITAAKFLDRLEEYDFADAESERLRTEHADSILVDLNDKPLQTLKRMDALRKSNGAYRQIYDRLIGRRGGLLALLNTPRPADFDRAVRERIGRMHIISSLIDYRLRYIQHGIGDPNASADRNGANHNHALFFCWWPTHEVPGKRGKASPNKSASIKTMRTWWKKMEGNAIFIYLSQKHGFDQLPCNTEDDFFVDGLLRDSNAGVGVLRFLGAYAYVTESFAGAHSDLVDVLPISQAIPRIPVATLPFLKIELETINKYDHNYTLMTE